MWYMMETCTFLKVLLNDKGGVNSYFKKMKGGYVQEIYSILPFRMTRDG